MNILKTEPPPPLIDHSKTHQNTYFDVKFQFIFNFIFLFPFDCDAKGKRKPKQKEKGKTRD